MGAHVLDYRGEPVSSHFLWLIVILLFLTDGNAESYHVPRSQRALILVQTRGKYRRDSPLDAVMASVYTVCAFKFQAFMLQ